MQQPLNWTESINSRSILHYLIKGIKKHWNINADFADLLQPIKINLYYALVFSPN